jgi:hypothetical protein
MCGTAPVCHTHVSFVPAPSRSNPPSPPPSPARGEGVSCQTRAARNQPSCAVATCGRSCPLVTAQTYSAPLWRRPSRGDLGRGCPLVTGVGRSSLAGVLAPISVRRYSFWSRCPAVVLANGIIGKQVRAFAGLVSARRNSCTAPAAVGGCGCVLHATVSMLTGRRHVKAHESEDRPGPCRRHRGRRRAVAFPQNNNTGPDVSSCDSTAHAAGACIAGRKHP